MEELGPQAIEDGTRSEDRARAEREFLKAPLPRPTPWRPRDHEHGAPEQPSMFGGIARAAPVPGLDDDERVRERDEKLVPPEELRRMRAGIRRHARDVSAARCEHFLIECAVLGWIRLAKPRRRHHDRTAADIQRTAMRRSIDADRAARKDRHAVSCQRAGQVPRILQRLGRWAARSNDGYGGAARQLTPYI